MVKKIKFENGEPNPKKFDKYNKDEIEKIKDKNKEDEEDE